MEGENQFLTEETETGFKILDVIIVSHHYEKDNNIIMMCTRDLNSAKNFIKKAPDSTLEPAKFLYIKEEAGIKFGYILDPRKLIQLDEPGSNGLCPKTIN